MNTAFRQTANREQSTLGGSPYTRQYSQFGVRESRGISGIWISTPQFTPQSKLHGHFAPVASEELLGNRRPATTDLHRRKRSLPLVKATGRTIVQAEIDDALDD